MSSIGLLTDNISSNEKGQSTSCGHKSYTVRNKTEHCDQHTMTFGYDTQPFRDTNLTPSLSEAKQLLVNFTVILRNISKIEIVASIIAV